MSKVYINQIDYYIPETKLWFKDHLDEITSVNNVFNTPEKFMRFAEKVLSIESVNVEHELTLEEMANKLIDKNVAAKQVDPTLIKYVIIASDYGDQLVNYGHALQHKFGMVNARVFKISGNYCTNVDLSIGILNTLLSQETTPCYAIVVCGCKHKPDLAGRIIGSYAVMGDSAGLAILSNQPESKLLEVGQQSIITQGVLHDVDLAKDNTLLHYQSYVTCLENLFKKSNISPGLVDTVILHNSNLLLVEQALKASGINISKISRLNKTKYGHLGSTDLLLNLNTYITENNNEKQLLMSLNLGVSGTYVGTLYYS